MTDSIKIPLYSRRHGQHFSTINKEDFDLVSQLRWYYRKYGRNEYARTVINIDGRKEHITMRCFIIDPENGKIIDHIDGDGLNNTRANLRECTHQENIYNSRPRLKGSSKFKGVSKVGKSSWCSNIAYNGKKIRLGTFETEEAAAIAYNDAAKKYHGSFARLNILSTGLLLANTSSEKYRNMQNTSDKKVKKQ